MRLWLSTWPEVEAYLRDSTGVILPIGSTEQHGPTGLIGTDSISAERIAWRAGELSGALIGPTIGIGMAQHHMAFPGTVTLMPSTLIAVVRDCVLSLAEHGFRRFLFVNGHGGNVATVTAGFQEIYRELRTRQGAAAPDLRCLLANWWQGPTVKPLAESLYGGAEGSHATPSEVAVTQFAFPEHVKQAPLDPPVAPKGRFHGATDYRRRFPDGRIGSNPALATVEDGGRLLAAAAADVVDLYRRLLAEE